MASGEWRVASGEWRVAGELWPVNPKGGGQWREKSANLADCRRRAKKTAQSLLFFPTARPSSAGENGS